MLKATVPKATNVCQYDQLCAGLKAEIDGAIQGVLSILNANLSTEKWEFLLVDIENALNKINHIVML